MHGCFPSHAIPCYRDKHEPKLVIPNGLGTGNNATPGVIELVSIYLLGSALVIHGIKLKLDIILELGDNNLTSIQTLRASHSNKPQGGEGGWCPGLQRNTSTGIVSLPSASQGGRGRGQEGHQPASIVSSLTAYPPTPEQPYSRVECTWGVRQCQCGSTVPNGAQHVNGKGFEISFLRTYLLRC